MLPQALTQVLLNGSPNSHCCDADELMVTGKVVACWTLLYSLPEVQLTVFHGRVLLFVALRQTARPYTATQQERLTLMTRW